MCGITGFISKNFSNDQWVHTLKSMSQTMAHRGPDDDGIWFDQNTCIGMAHRRLSIIDLTQEGHQPMVSVSGRFVISYNGEIYNFPEIRKNLEHENIKWRGHSDTEVILSAIETWGIEAAVKQFVGIFAFGLWDRETRVLYLCRDQLGVKPLYYSCANNNFIFGSELKPIRKHPEFKSEIDRDALCLFFRHNYIPAPYSIYKNTWKLPPGNILEVSLKDFQEGRKLPAPKPYWSAINIATNGQRRPFSLSPDEAVNQLEVLLMDAVKLQMISDVPLGAFLSGGIDSSTIVALMQIQSSRRVKTFSIGFQEKGYNEAEYAKSVAEFLGTDHTEHYVTPDDALQVISDLPELYDEPFSDSSQIPTFLLSKMTRQYVTVSLSGDGGDELFGGYNRYFWGKNIWKVIGWMPFDLRSRLSAYLKKISPSRWDSVLFRLIAMLPNRYKLDMPGDRVHKLADVIASGSPDMMYHLLISHWKNTENIVIGGHEPLTVITDPKTKTPFEDFTNQMMFFDLVTYLPDDILTKLDRASMGVGLESRVPLLDHRVVEFAWKLPLSMKIKGNQGKWILRQVLYNHVPKALLERPKTGFGIPLDAWLRGPLRDWAEDLLSEKRLSNDGILNPYPIREKWLEHLSEKRNWQYHLWNVLMFQAWKDQYKL